MISCYIYLNIIYREKKEFRNKREKKMGKQRIREIEQKGTKNPIDIRKSCVCKMLICLFMSYIYHMIYIHITYTYNTRALFFSV